MESSYPIRINKYLNETHGMSRRSADTLIAAGKVLVNGTPATLGDMVNEDDEVTLVDHDHSHYVYYAYYKPKGVVTVNAEPGEKEIASIASFPQEVFPLGRLDKDSEGLIIMTNDGSITRAFTDPDQGIEKEYAVTLNRPLTHQALVRLRSGVRIDIGKKKYTTKKAPIRRTSKTSFDIILTEGKNRQIRKMCGAVGFQVVKLKRFRIKNIELGNMKPGQWRKLKASELGV
ncbi:MAG: rRNA pseudouridine synthase [Candidatus Pacebacteria bacterium]|nr:rRNA pseudouridine synthase [Candidatus Paceibacterota bacterium]MCD8508255.1 rRNA pseudouridine synthase [Candidatus Paceibacterota bacterium]MCD8527731.1 rRNA pseudouridine synthase [Candidatus Paceibacterota bacterium]MCD8563481.1 rRNA pseudouridine synthase [Candidatus Paceibacterota bacterium]